jgi:hypothetical protein
MSLDTSLCVYTNCSKFNSNDIDLITTTIESFNNTFDISNINKIIVFIDSNPETQNFHTYQRQIENYLLKWKDKNPQVISTLGLSDGYLKSLSLINSKFIFQLEHDWIFVKEHIQHDLSEILSMMEKNNLHYLRFNKRENIAYFWDKYIKEIIMDDIKVCETPNMSNNPHIINREIYRKEEYDKIIKLKQGSHGIEEEFNLNKKVGYLYGKESHPATIIHLDGKKEFKLK